MQANRQHFQKIALVFLISWLLALGILASGFLTKFELTAFDKLSRLCNPEQSPGDIIIVAIDQQSIDLLRAENVVWPWPRQMYAPVFDYLKGADAVFIDMIFSEPSSYGEEDDKLLTEAIAGAGNVFLPIFLTDSQRPLTQGAQAFLRKTAVLGKVAAPLVYRSAITEIDPLLTAARGGGNVMIKPDQDGVYRRVPLTARLGELTLPHFVLGYLLEQKIVTINDGSLVDRGTQLPLTDSQLLLRYYRGAKPFPVLPAATLIKSYLAEQSGEKPAVSRDYFRGKKVLIGPTAAGLYDLKPTAVSSVASGVHIHATTLDNLLRATYITALPVWWVIGCMLLVSLLASWFVLTHHTLTANLSFLCGGLLVLLGLPALLFSNGLYLQAIPPLLAFILSTTGAAAYSYATEGRERRFVRRAFAQYMDETIVAHLLKNPDLIRPGGQRRRVTVFFADIAGFTTIAEQNTAEETAHILHTALNAFSEVVIEHHGVIDKYIGDCIMAFWGAPLDSKEDESNACRAAISCMDALTAINRELRARGLAEITIRIGIHSGDAIVGNLGSDRLFDYTVVGDTVNLASRLESANKQFKTRIMVSEETLLRTGNLFLARELGLIEVKGKTRPVRIFELLAIAASASDEVTAKAELWRTALTAFHEQRWQEAVALLDQQLLSSPNDGPATYYRKWCDTLMNNPPLTDEWNVIKLTEK